MNLVVEYEILTLSAHDDVGHADRGSGLAACGRGFVVPFYGCLSLHVVIACCCFYAWQSSMLGFAEMVEWIEVTWCTGGAG